MAGEKSFGRTLKNVLLALIVVGLLCALLYGTHRWTERYDNALNVIAAEFEQQSGSLADLESLLAQQSDAMQQQFSHQQTILDEHQLLLRRLSQISGDEWQLREAYALSRMAQQRLQLMGDYDGAVRLLNAASSVLHQTKLPADSNITQLLKQDAELIGNWYQSAQKNLHASFDVIRGGYPVVFKSAQELSLHSESEVEGESWQEWFSRLPLRFTARDQADVASFSTDQVRQHMSLFRFLFAQVEIAGLMQKHGDQVRILDEMRMLVTSLHLADRQNLVLLQQAIEDARVQAESLGKQLELKSPAALASLVQGG